MSDPKITLRGVGKRYKLFPNKWATLFDAMGFAGLLPLKKMRYSEFWALRDINVELQSGQRIGIIGRNGAGKSTLLKLVCGNIKPTEGRVQVNGSVQALLETGAGFHPEFTGLENIRASLTYLGLSSAEINRATEEIIDFTELGRFIGQPFKTYSAGMKARLTFTTATVLNPDILIIDEILGAGDGYFIQKSTERIRKLVEDSGATVLIVSHSTDQIVQMCDMALWLDRGMVVRQGSSLEVAKAYDQYLSVLNDRRVRARNYCKNGGHSGEKAPGESRVCVLFSLMGSSPRASCDVSKVSIREFNTEIERLLLGAAQDVDPRQSAYLEFDGESGWSSPQKQGGVFFRSTCPVDGVDVKSSGWVVFHVYSFMLQLEYSFEIEYRCTDLDGLNIEIWCDGTMLERFPAPVHNDWGKARFSLTPKGETTAREPEEAEPCSGQEEKTETPQPPPQPPTTEKPADAIGEPPAQPEPSSGRQALRRWSGSKKIVIDKVTMHDGGGREKYTYHHGDALSFQIGLRATSLGELPILPVITIFTTDGIKVTNLYPEKESVIDFKAPLHTIYFDIGALNLGGGRYVFSVALFEHEITADERYDLIDRSFEFDVIHPEAISRDFVFTHPGRWRMG